METWERTDKVRVTSSASSHCLALQIPLHELITLLNRTRIIAKRCSEGLEPVGHAAPSQPRVNHVQESPGNVVERRLCLR